MTPEEEKLKREELELDKSLRERSLRLQSRELLLKTITNPLLIVVITAAVAIYGNHLVSEHNKAASDLASRRFNSESALAQKRFCYEVLSDLVIKNGEKRREAALELGRLLKTDLIADCEGDLREAADFYSGVDPPAVIPPSPEKICTAIKSLKELGWRSGHKTKFCIAKKYDGVHNPFGDYGAGGFCFKGDPQACIAEIEKR